jgi:hypothetical protein
MKRVKTTTKVLMEGGFKKAFQALPYNSIREAREKIMFECDWSRATFGKKRQGIIPYTRFERQFITEFFAKYNLDAWSGELLK